MNHKFQKVVCARCLNNPCLCEPVDSAAEVPYEVADLEVTHPFTTVNHVVKEMSGGRRVEVAFVLEKPGLYFRFFHPTQDGKMSRLSFGLKPDACLSLFDALSIQLQRMPPPSQEPEPPSNQKVP